MKNLLLAAILILTGFNTLKAQAQAEYDTTAPYKKTRQLPEFKIIQGDSTWYTNKDLPKNKPIVLIYFSPDCGHCQLTAQELVKNMDQLKDIFFLMVSYHTPDKIKAFAKEYKLDHYSNVRLGRDPSYSVPAFYRVKFTPFMAAYNKQGKLLQSWDQGTDPLTLARLYRNSK